MDALGEYTVVPGGDAMPGAWTLEGTDASSFMLEGTGNSRMLKFSSAPDYDNPMGGADDDSNTYEVTLKVTDSSESDIFGTFAVSVTVTDVDELGALSGSTTNVSVNEGDMDALGTYTLTEIEDGSTVTWSLDGTDMSDFMLEGTGMSRMLKFSSAPDYETTMGGADADSNTYMVTVIAKAGGEMEMVEVTVMVTNMEEAGTVTLDPVRPSVGTEITATLADEDIFETVSWQWASADAMDGDFTNIDDATMYTYTPVEGDAGMYLRATATYDDGYDTGNVEMKVTDSAVSQLAVNGPDAATYEENGTDAVGTYTASGGGGDTVSWMLDGADASQFRLDGTGMSRMLKFSSAPDYESPMGGADDDSNTYMVTVKAEAGSEMEMVEVTIMVTDVDELGTLEGDDSLSYAEGGTDAVETYTVSGGDGSTVNWSLDGADASQFMLEGTGMSRMLKFSSTPDYESPMGGADDSNTYMVTVKAEAGGENGDGGSHRHGRRRGRTRYAEWTGKPQPHGERHRRGHLHGHGHHGRHGHVDAGGR